jgi:hypothetical protein
MTLSHLPSAPLEPVQADPFVKPAAPDDPALLTRVLRVAGSVLLIAAACTFMLTYWQSGNDLIRYGMLLGQTVLLAVAAYFCGVKVRESRGARTFLALLLAVVPANFAVLGGMLYHDFSWDPVRVQLPAYVTWVAPSPVHAVVACAVAVLVLTPLCFVAFLALARAEARRLTLVFLGCNLLVLLPVRDPNVMATVVGAVGAALIALDVKRFHPKSSLTTLEGRLVRTILAVPPVLMVARCLHLYHPTLLFGGIVALSVAGALLMAALRRRDAGHSGESLLATSSLVALCGWGCCAGYLFQTFAFPDSAALPLAGLPAAALLFGLSFVTRGGGSQYRGLASVVAFGAVAANLLVFPDWVASLCVVVVGVALLAHGAAIRNTPALVAGAGALALGVVYHMRFALQLHGFAWVALSLLGVGLIVGASLVERNHAGFFAYLRRLRPPV